jgi:hypothetical protein
MTATVLVPCGRAAESPVLALTAPVPAPSVMLTIDNRLSMEVAGSARVVRWGTPGLARCAGGGRL